MCSGTIWIQDASFVIDIASVEKFIESVSGFTSVYHVPFHGVEVANPPGKLDMTGIVETGVSKHNNTILQSQHQPLPSITIRCVALNTELPLSGDLQQVEAYLGKCLEYLIELILGQIFPVHALHFGCECGMHFLDSYGFERWLLAIATHDF
jgi:hypothetical protein